MIIFFHLVHFVIHSLDLILLLICDFNCHLFSSNQKFIVNFLFGLLSSDITKIYNPIVYTKAVIVNY